MAYPPEGDGARRLRRTGALPRRAGEAGACGNGTLYIILSFVLDPMPDGAMGDENSPTSSELLDAVDAELSAGEKRLREMERYVTSDTFTLRSRFRQL